MLSNFRNNVKSYKRLKHYRFVQVHSAELRYLLETLF